MVRLVGKRRAFTLLETMVTIAIFTIALLILVLVFTRGLGLMSKSTEVTHATEVGREVLERVRALGYHGIPAPPRDFDGRGASPDPSIPGPPAFPPAPYPATEVAGRSYPIIVRVRNPGGGELRAVEVEVPLYPEGHIRLQTYLHP